MNSLDDQAHLALLGGSIEPQRLVVPPQVLLRVQTYRQACRLAWKLRRSRNLTRRTLAELAGLYTSHVSDYFSLHDNRRELPARHIAIVERVLGNTVVSQWVAQESQLTVLEGLQADQRSRRRA